MRVVINPALDPPAVAPPSTADRETAATVAASAASRIRAIWLIPAKTAAPLRVRAVSAQARM